MTFFSASEGRGNKYLASRRSTVVSVLDVGSNKIVCLIARLRPHDHSDALPGRTHAIDLLGVGHTRSRGIKSGVVINLDTAEAAIRQAVDTAERMAKVTVDSLLVGVSCGRLGSETYAASVGLTGRPVSDQDISRVLAAGAVHAVARHRTSLHSLPVGYSLDAERHIRDPRGMVGASLGVDMHMVTADAAPIANLELAVNRCHLSVARMVAAPYASGLAAMVDDEAELGCVCLDFGAGTTSIAVFAGGHLVHVDAIAIGGQHITNDIARGLSIRLEDAERLKTMHGSAIALASDDREAITVTPLGSDERDGGIQIPRSTLTRIVKARIDETLEVVRDRLNASGFASMVGRRLVLTGGGSQLTGITEAARRIVARDVRHGRPLGVRGMPELAKGPAFAGPVGLLIYPQVAEFEQLADMPTARPAMTGTGGYFSRVSQWIRESF